MGWSLSGGYVMQKCKLPNLQVMMEGKLICLDQLTRRPSEIIGGIPQLRRNLETRLPDSACLSA
jgi:hypothetical protein